MDVVNFFNDFNPFKAIRMSHQTVEVFGTWHLYLQIFRITNLLSLKKFSLHPELVLR